MRCTETQPRLSTMKKLFLTLLMAFGLVGAASAAGAGIPLDSFPKQRSSDLAALQNGAKIFANYCLNCHSAAFMRYNRLRDIGLTEEQIKGNLMFTTDKVGETMRAALSPKLAKDLFGAAPPDLTLIARSRAQFAQGENSGPDYLYTFLRSYYRDPNTPTGWNNLAFPNVGMPNPLWEWQGMRVAKFEDRPDPHNPGKVTSTFVGFEQTSAGTMTAAQYDQAVADLVAYLRWMAEPMRAQRIQLGVFVMIFLGIFTVIAYFLNKAYWKDVK
jgi:ubiquinol-cytochrome c reductase cytochrome c1 subunit